MIQEEEGKGAEGLFSDVESRMEAKRVAMEQELRSVMKRKMEKKKRNQLKKRYAVVDDDDDDDDDDRYLPI